MFRRRLEENGYDESRYEEIGLSPQEIRIEKGYAIEQKTIKALLEFVGSEECPEWLLEFIPTQGTIDDQERGIDGIFVTDEGEVLAQFTTSARRRLTKEEEYPEVEVFLVRSWSLTDEEIVEIFLPRITEIRNKRARYHRP